MREQDRHRKAVPLLAVENEQEAYTLLERVAERKQGRYYVPGWTCPAAPGDNQMHEALRDPAYRVLLEHAANRLPKVVDLLNQEYDNLRRDMGKAA